jgi:multisubunit Na+/H+ antiporter MnhB subunit
LNISNSVGAPSKWIETFARFGLSAKGAVYCITGILAFMAAFQIGNATEKDAGKREIFKTIEEQPFGMWLIAAIGVGLVFFCFWRFFQAIRDTEHKGSDVKGLGKRLAYLFSGIAYSGLALYAIKYFLNQQKSSGGGSRQRLVQDILEKPLGQVLVVVLALIIAGVGIYQLYFAISGKYKKYVESSGLKHEYKSLILRSGKVGHIARGIVWLIIAWLFMKAALQNNSNEVGGADTAFHWLKTSPFGSYLLGAVAVGLICYGFYMFVRARYQPVSTR